MNENGTSVPEWFTWALGQAPEHHDVEVAGARIHYRTWGEPGRPGLIMLHGGSAHSGWWDHIAPFFAETHYVVAPDLSGHGDSDRRSNYFTEFWVQEVEAIAKIASTDGNPPIHIGHSLGGRAPIILDVAKPGLISRVIAVDTILADALPVPRTDEASLRPLRVYETRAQAAARWIPIPTRPLALPYVAAHVGEESVAAVDGGYSWKFDNRINTEDTSLRGALENSTLPITWICSEYGLIDAAARAEVQAAIGDRVEIIELPVAGHHAMLDQPLVLVAALRSVLGAHHA
jgi:pimeloyl-ACP methyl ester carboxylesterase